MSTKFNEINDKLDKIANSKNKTNQYKKQIDKAYNQYSTTTPGDQYDKDLKQKVNIMKSYPEFNSTQVDAYKTVQRNINYLEDPTRTAQPVVLLQKGTKLFPDNIMNVNGEFRQPALQHKFKEYQRVYKQKILTGDSSTAGEGSTDDSSTAGDESSVDSSTAGDGSTFDPYVRTTSMRTLKAVDSKSLHSRTGDPPRGEKGSRTLNIFLLLLGIVLCLIGIYFFYMQFTKRRQQKIAVEEEPVVGDVVEEEPVVEDVIEEEPVVVVGDVVEENNSFFFFLVFLSLVTIYYFKLNKKKNKKKK